MYIRWNIFMGIMFSVTGMCLLNYYSLFPDAEEEERQRKEEKEKSKLI